jgi:malate synthase
MTAGRAAASPDGGTGEATGAAVTWSSLAPGVEVNSAGLTAQARRILGPEPIGLLASLHRELQPDRRTLLGAREERQRAWDEGALPGYLDDDVALPARGDWRIRALPADLLQRRVEITGPVNDAKMVINMLSRGEDGQRADAAMLDFEDSMKPTWANVMQGMENLAAAAEGTLTYRKGAAGGQPEKVYRLDPADMPLVMVRCRGLHLDESNLRVDGEPVAGGLFDLALAASHTARALIARGRTPKLYVPKVEHHLEARWWNRVLTRIEEGLLLAVGTIRATFLIETLPAAFQMEEILWELKDHAAGLNVGRWDKIFSDIKVLKAHRDRILADRGSISLNRPWMRNYAERLIQICHRHGAFAMGGMAAFTPGKTAELRAEQTRKVVEDKRFERELGHDGCWVSHPYFIGPALSAFPRSNQLDAMPAIPDRPDLLPVATPPRTLEGLRKNLRVGIGYLEGWRRGIGCVAWDDLMEDLATLEISRAQTWQWLHHGVRLDDGTAVTRELVGAVFGEELGRIASEISAAMAGSPEADRAAAVERFERARDEAEAVFTETEFRPFLSRASELAR